MEQDLLRQLADKDQSIEKIRTEVDKQAANYRSENFDLLKSKQKLEIDLNGAKLDLDNCQQAHSAESKRLQEEVRVTKARLTTTQETLAAYRQECLNLSEVRFSPHPHVFRIKV